MNKVSHPDFDRRVNFAASRISSGRRTTRAFDNCFESHDGEAVALALYIRAQRAPNTKLAKNISRYITGSELVAVHGPLSLDDLRRLSFQLIERAKAYEQRNSHQDQEVHPEHPGRDVRAPLGF